MTDDIKLPPFPDGMCLREDIEDYARAAVEADRAALQAEIQEHARLLGMSAEREAALLARIAELEAKLAEAQKQMERQKDEWLAWAGKRASLEKDAARLDKLAALRKWTHSGDGYYVSEVRLRWGDSLVMRDLRAAIDAVEAKP